MTEDMPGWDCHTMGNLICGTASLPDTAAAVPHGLPLDGIGFVLTLVVVALVRRIRKAD